VAITRRSFLATTSAAALGAAAGCQRSRRRRPEDVREVGAIIAAVASTDGAGVKLRRSLGHRALPMLDPFLLLDEIRSSDPADYRAGFPTHPHRGFETVSYLISGAFEHRDSAGNAGTISDGGVQWMTAGRGIVHSEMPRQRDGLELWGLQLWVNLPAARKMTAPRYQDLGSPAIPELDVGDARVRLVAGSIGRARGPVDRVAVAPIMLDVALEPGAVFRHDLPASHGAFAYALEGSIELGARRREVAARHIATLEPGRREVRASSPRGGRFLLLAAAPIGEPVARRGPFVMNTEAELRQAFEDLRTGRLAR
jgi:hypothetical protein